MPVSNARSPATTAAERRKADHLRIAAGDGIEHESGTGLASVRLRHRALPERALASVTLDSELLGARLLANLGAAQVRGIGGPERAERLVELLDADGLSIHLNPLQEAVQPEGEPDFAGVLDGIAAAVARLAPRPAVVKEVGFGMDAADVALLREAGVAAVDVAGSGGTNWALVEGRRDPRAGDLAVAFADWGVPTVEALLDARAVAGALPLIASGGLHDGVDAAKCLALGAAAAGLARPFLVAALTDRATVAVGTVVEQLRIATWAAGAPSAAALSGEHLRCLCFSPPQEKSQ